jgi:hypothetical protein
MWLNILKICVLSIIGLIIIIVSIGSLRENTYYAPLPVFQIQDNDIIGGIGKKLCDPSKDGYENNKCDTNNDCFVKCAGITKCVNVKTNDNLHFKVAGVKDSVKLKAGKYCLPEVPKTGDCNQYTGRYVLSKIPGTNEYLWDCQCVYPNIVNKKTIYGNCDQVITCGNELNKDNVLINKNTKEVWTKNSDWDPYQLGICKCGGKNFDKSHDGKSCIPSHCGYNANIINQQIGCNCPNRYPPGTIPKKNSNNDFDTLLRCPQDFNDKLAKRLCSAYNPSCVKDPCNPGGYYNSNTGRCICNKDKNYYPIRSSGTQVGWTCSKLCDTEMGDDPCVYKGTRRGDCYVKTSIDNSLQGCANCKDPLKCPDCVIANPLCKNCNKYKKQQSNDGLCGTLCYKNSSICKSNTDCCSGKCTPYYNYYDSTSYNTCSN